MPCRNRLARERCRSNATSTSSIKQVSAYGAPPCPSMNPGASLRDRASLPSPLPGLVPSGGYPSRLRSLRSLRVPCPAARCAHRRLPGHRRGALLRRCGASTFVSCSRPRSHSPTPPCLRGPASPPLRRRGGSPSVPVPEPISPSVISGISSFSTAQRWRSHTRRIVDARASSGACNIVSRFPL